MIKSFLFFLYKIVYIIAIGSDTSVLHRRLAQTCLFFAWIGGVYVTNFGLGYALCNVHAHTLETAKQIQIAQESDTINTPSAAQQLTDILSKTHSFQANFVQTTLDANGRTVQTQKGTLAVKRPHMFRWEVIQPIPLVVVSDGAEVFVYDRELAQVSVSVLDPSQIDTPATLLSGDPNKVQQSFTVTRQSTGAIQRFQLIPKSQSNPYTLIIIVFDQNTLIELEMKDSFEQFSIVQFDQLRTNTTIQDTLFEFVIPQDVDVFYSTEIQ